MCVQNKAKLDSEPYSVTASPYLLYRSLLQLYTHILLGTFYSYRTARTCSEPRSVEHRLSFAVEVTTVSGNWKHPLPLKSFLVPVSNGYYVLEMADTYSSHIMSPQDRTTEVCLTYLYIYLYHLTSLLIQAIGPKVWIK